MTEIQAIAVDDRGSGRPLLLLHGGGGPRSVLPFAERLTAARDLRTITPTHPGFSDTPRPEALRTPPTSPASTPRSWTSATSTT